MSEIVYFDSPGKKNTDAVLEAVRKRINKGDIKHVVVASDSGFTAKKAIEVLKGKGIRVVVVTSQAGFSKEGETSMSREVEDQLTMKGIKVVRASHVLSGLERSISGKLGGSSRVEAVAETLRSLFGQGMKVCVEIAVMAADSGSIPCGNVEVISIAGTEWGADTAVVVRPAHANSFFNFEVREILAIPRLKKEKNRK